MHEAIIKLVYELHVSIFQFGHEDYVPGGSLPLIFCIHVRSGPIFWGGYLPCKIDYKVMVFYM
jgi:hypothetical protein